MTGILSLMTFLPAAGALFILAARWSSGPAHPGHDTGVKWIAFVTTLFTLAVNLVALTQFDAGAAGFQLVERIPWAIGLEYHMGVDQLAMALILLTNFLMPLCILASWSIEKQVSTYMMLFLLLQTLMQGVFAAMDIVLFYVFFEGGLIPMYLIIGIWGGAERIKADRKSVV